MGAAEIIEVQCAYALQDTQRVIHVRVPAGTTLVQAVRRSGILDEYPEIDLAASTLGVYGRRVDPNETARSGDRIEIYRPLVADPKVVRRERAGRRKSASSD